MIISQFTGEDPKIDPLLSSMDIGEITTHLPSLSAINDQLSLIIQAQVKKQLKVILANIAINLNIPLEDLNSQYLSNIEFNDLNSPILLKKKRKNLESNIRCKAKTSKNKRCTRKKKTNSFCGSHEHARPYGQLFDSDHSNSNSNSNSDSNSDVEDDSDSLFTKKKPTIIIKTKPS